MSRVRHVESLLVPHYRRVYRNIALHSSKEQTIFRATFVPDSTVALRAEPLPPLTEPSVETILTFRFEQADGALMWTCKFACLLHPDDDIQVND